MKNYPNPFNPTTMISFSLAKDTNNTQLAIYNIRGQKVKTLVNKSLPNGKHSVIWNGKNESGNAVVSGVYLYKLIVDGKVNAVRKSILMK